MNTFFTYPMKPYNFIKRNINIPSIFSYSIRNNVISNVNYLKSFFIKLRYSYIAFFIIFISTINYSQELLSINRGTTVVGIARNDTIWIGADSKMEDGTTKCKIVKTDSMVFTHAGIFNESITQINIDTLFVRTVRKVRNVKETREWFNYAMRYILQLTGSLKMPGSIKYRIGDKILEDQTGCLIATYLNGKPIIYTHEYITTVLDNNLASPCQTRTDVIYDSYVTEMGGFRIFSFGYDKLIRNATEDFSNWDIPTLINHLIGMEINRTPSKVGKPISIIRLTKNKIEWVQKGLCEP